MCSWTYKLRLEDPIEIRRCKHKSYQSKFPKHCKMDPSYKSSHILTTQHPILHLTDTNISRKYAPLSPTSPMDHSCSWLGIALLWNSSGIWASSCIHQLIFIQGCRRLEYSSIGTRITKNSNLKYRNSCKRRVLLLRRSSGHCCSPSRSSQRHSSTNRVGCRCIWWVSVDLKCWNCWLRNSWRCRRTGLLSSKRRVFCIHRFDN